MSEGDSTKCLWCGADFASRGRVKKHCSSECRVQYQIHLRRQRHPAKLSGQTLICLECGATFEGGGRRSRYCGAGCLAAAKKKQVQLAAAIYYEEHKEELKTKRRESKTPIACLWCGVSFLPGLRRKTCSGECSAKAKAARTASRSKTSEFRERKRQLRTPEAKAKERAYSKLYAERRREIMKDYRERNRDRMREWKKQYMSDPENRQKSRGYWRRHMRGKMQDPEFREAHRLREIDRRRELREIRLQMFFAREAQILKEFLSDERNRSHAQP